VLTDVDVAFDEGAFYALIGPNGAGKSTLLALLSGRLTPQSGVVRFRGRPVMDWPRKAFARQVAVVPQSEKAVFEFTVRQIVLMGRYAHQESILGIEDREDHEITERALGATDMLPLADRKIGFLSGGERQRALVARALAQEAPVLLLDEPTTALDPYHQKMLLDLLLKLNREEGRTILLVTHDLSLVGSYAAQVAVLADGKIARIGPTPEIIDTDFLSSLYATSIGVTSLSNQTVHVGLVR